MLTIRTVKDLRRKLGWTQARLAKSVGLSQGRISAYENGTQLALLKCAKLIKLAEKHGLRFEVD